METQKSYFFQSFLILLLAAIFFLVLKPFLPTKIFPENKISSKNVLIDSMLIDAVAEQNIKNDSAIEVKQSQQPIFYKNTNGVQFPVESFENYTGNQYLISFYEKLFQLETNKTGNVRVAYFGDSMTDADYIVQDLRNNLQTKFGGSGVGFVSITSESAASRGSVFHEFSKNWKMQSYLNVKKPTSPFGINGHVFFANDTTNSAWVKFKSGYLQTQKLLENATIFYGNASNQNAKVFYAIGKDTLSKKLRASNILNTTLLSQNGIKSLKINFKNARNVPFYGVNFDDQKGIHVDNFSQRGMSGLPIAKFDVDLMSAFQQKLDYDLIVLHYGTNVLNYGTKDYSWYEKSMTRTVNHLHQCFPGISILIISTADKSTKYNSEMQTDSAVVPLSISQKKYALSTQSGFTNLYTLMGGSGSMVKWAEEIPVNASKDYTHFNLRGSKKIANILYENLMQGYNQYKTLRRIKKLMPTATLENTLIPDSINENP